MRECLQVCSRSGFHIHCAEKIAKITKKIIKSSTKSPKIQNSYTYFAFKCARGDILETRVWGLRERKDFIPKSPLDNLMEDLDTSDKKFQKN